MEREAKITNTEEQEFTVFENRLGESRIAPVIPLRGHTMRFERGLEVDSENPNGEGRNHLSPEELLARDE